MKKLLLLFLISFSSTFAQTFNQLDFFPHKVGDTWDYNTDVGPERQVIYKDSIDAEGLHHLFISTNGYENPKSTYIIDTTNYLVYNLSADAKWLYYKLKADSGESWIVDTLSFQTGDQYKIAQVDTVNEVTLFGSLRHEMKVTYYNYQTDTVINESSTPNYSETLVEGLGEYLEFYPDQGGALKSLQDCIINGDSLSPSSSSTSINNDEIKISSFSLYQNYPNPFNPTTKISYSIPNTVMVTLKVYDILGREVSTLVNKEQNPGNYEVEFNAGNLPSGIYLARLTYGQFTKSIKMILQK